MSTPNYQNIENGPTSRNSIAADSNASALWPFKNVSQNGQNCKLEMAQAISEKVTSLVHLHRFCQNQPPVVGRDVQAWTTNAGRDIISVSTIGMGAIIEELIIRMVWTDTNTADSIQILFPWLWDHIDIGFNNDLNYVQTIQFFDLFLKQCMGLDSDDNLMLSVPEGRDSDGHYSVGANMQGNTVVRYFKIPCFVNNGSFYANWVRSVDVYLNYAGESRACYTNTATGGSTSLTNLNLILKTVEVDGQEQARLNSIITASQPLVYNFTGSRYLTSVNQVYSNGSQYSIILSGVRGLCKDLTFVFLPSLNGPDLLTATNLVSSIDIIDPSGTSIFGGQVVNADMIQSELAVHNHLGLLVYYWPCYPICFCEGGSYGNSGQNTGGLLMTGNSDYQLIVNTASSALFTAGTYRMLLVCHMADELLIFADGSYTIQKSN